MQLFVKSNWESFKGQTDWLGSGPGTGLKHKVCGHEIREISFLRTIWEKGLGPCAGSEVKEVSMLYCTQCHKRPNLKSGESIQRDDILEIT